MSYDCKFLIWSFCIPYYTGTHVNKVAIMQILIATILTVEKMFLENHNKKHKDNSYYLYLASF